MTQLLLTAFAGAGTDVPKDLQDAVHRGEQQATLLCQALRLVEKHGPRVVAEFMGTPLLSPEDHRSICKDDRERLAALRLWGGCVGGACGGAAGPRAKCGCGKCGGGSGVTASPQSVSLTPSDIVVPLSSGSATSEESPGTCRRPALRSSPQATFLYGGGGRSLPMLCPETCNGPSLQVSDALDRLEGGMVTESEQGLAIMYESDSMIESRLTGTLKAHLPQLKHIGASNFALSVIEHGYIPKLSEMPVFYAEPNNKSYRDHVEFANWAVMKLLGIGVVAEVPCASWRCINPLTVTQNTAKLHLCIDLSRYFNMQCDAQTFKIELTVQALASIDPCDFMFSFDLKSAYLQVPMNPVFWPYLGFAIQIPQHGGISEHFFCYKMLPFSLNDVACVLTKLMGVPIKHWHAQGIFVFIHLDNGFNLAHSKELALRNSAAVHIDLQALGLLISEEKCSWGAHTVQEWIGFVWDTVCFRLFVMDKKVNKALALVAELSGSEGKSGN